MGFTSEAPAENQDVVKSPSTASPAEYPVKFDDDPTLPDAVISCEPLCTLFNRQPPLAEALAEKAARMGVRLTIVLMLRRQDHLKESVFSQVVKTWYSGSVIDDGIYDYDFNNRVLIVWIHRIGATDHHDDVNLKIEGTKAAEKVVHVTGVDAGKSSDLSALDFDRGSCGQLRHLFHYE